MTLSGYFCFIYMSHKCHKCNDNKNKFILFYYRSCNKNLDHFFFKLIIFHNNTYSNLEVVYIYYNSFDFMHTKNKWILWHFILYKNNIYTFIYMSQMLKHLNYELNQIYTLIMCQNKVYYKCIMEKLIY